MAAGIASATGRGRRDPLVPLATGAAHLYHSQAPGRPARSSPDLCLRRDGTCEICRRCWGGTLPSWNWMRLLDFGAAKPVLAEQRRGIPDIWRAAVHPAAADLFSQLKAGSASVEEAMAASRRLLVDEPGEPASGHGIPRAAPA
jgi:hypothetical protein